MRGVPTSFKGIKVKGRGRYGGLPSIVVDSPMEGKEVETSRLTGM